MSIASGRQRRPPRRRGRGSGFRYYGAQHVPVGPLSAEEFREVEQAVALAIRRSGRRWGIEAAVTAASNALGAALVEVEAGRELWRGDPREGLRVLEVEP